MSAEAHSIYTWHPSDVIKNPIPHACKSELTCHGEIIFIHVRIPYNGVGRIGGVAVAVVNPTTLGGCKTAAREERSLGVRHPHPAIHKEKSYSYHICALQGDYRGGEYSI